MKKHYYTKIKNVFYASEKLYFQRVGGDVYATNGYILVRFPDWLYWDEFAIPDGAIFNRTTFPTIEDGERLTVTGDELELDGPDLVDWWQKTEHNPDRDFRLTRPIAKGKISNRSVRFCETRTPYPVALNNKYFEAMEQATRGGLMYADGMKHPVWFYDCPEIYRSAFCGCVLPINYNVMETDYPRQEVTA